MAKLLRIFISPPGDVVPGRRRAALIIEKLAKGYARFFEIEPYLWESEPMSGRSPFGCGQKRGLTLPAYETFLSAAS